MATRTLEELLADFEERITRQERRLSPSPSTAGAVVIGGMMPFAGANPPDGFLVMDGAAVSRTTYPDLFTVLNRDTGTGTVTIASPGVWTKTAHGLYTGRAVYLTTTGALPTGLAANTAYYLIRVTADTFRLATTYANAVAGTAINTSGSQSGVHSIFTTYGIGDGSTTFNIPDTRGRVLVGWDESQPEFDAMGEVGGEKEHTLITSEMPVHTHSSGSNTNGFVAHATGGSGFSAIFINDGTGEAMFYRQPANAGSGAAHNNLQPYLVIKWIIRAL